MTNQQTGYSYVRFSSLKQKKGASVERQIAETRLYAAQNNIILDESLNLRDEGLSGFTGENLRSGAMGVFLEACKNGIVKKGSVLLVEAIDRISRMPHNQAYRLILDLLDYVDIVTVKDQRRYSKNNLDTDLSGPIVLALSISLAHKESQQKSERVKAGKALSAARKIANKEAFVVGRRQAFWIDVVDGKFVINEEKNLVLDALKMYENGAGMIKICADLNNKYGKNWEPSVYTRLVRNTVLYGTATRCGHVVDYFPALITKQRFDKIQAILSSRSVQSKRGEFNYVFSGVAECASCGGVTAFRSGVKGKYNYLRCRNAIVKKCADNRSVHIEPYLLSALKQMFNKSHQIKQGKLLELNNAAFAKLSDDIKAMTATVARLVKLLAISDSEELTNEYISINDKLKDAKKQLSAMELKSSIENGDIGPDDINYEAMIKKLVGKNDSGYKADINRRMRELGIKIPVDFTIENNS